MRSEADIEDLYGRHKHIQLPLAATFLRHHGIVFSPHLNIRTDLMTNIFGYPNEETI